MFDATSLLHNKLMTEIVYEIKVHDKVFRIEQGCKPMKMLGKILREINDPVMLEYYENARLAHSRILNDKMLRGELCFSIHPLDYMTMSDNTYHWSSCMSWQENGCYKLGTVEMMNSESAVVCYLKGDESMTISGKYWNSKKWRTLLIANKDLVINVKSYPYQHDKLSKIAVKTLAKIMGYNEETYSYEDGRYIVFDETQKMTYGFTTGAMYNDICADHQKRFVCVKDRVNLINKGTSYYCYSGEAVCMECGNVITNYSDEEGLLICSNCDGDSCRCDCCGRRVYETYYVENADQDFCNECIRDYCVWDGLKRGYYHMSYNESSYEVHIIPDDVYYENKENPNMDKISRIEEKYYSFDIISSTLEDDLYFKDQYTYIEDKDYDTLYIPESNVTERVKRAMERPKLFSK